jgi:hypothetical protein
MESLQSHSQRYFTTDGQSVCLGVELTQGLVTRYYFLSEGFCLKIAGSVIPPGTGFPLRRLLRLLGYDGGILSRFHKGRVLKVKWWPLQPKIH